MGTAIRLVVGNDVTISRRHDHHWLKTDRQSDLEIGSDSYIGYRDDRTHRRGVHIGQHVLIANRVYIGGDDSHPLDFSAHLVISPLSKTSNRS